MSWCAIDATRLACALAERLLPDEQRRRFVRLRFHDAGHGHDPFGLHPAWVTAGAALLRPIYERYFRSPRAAPSTSRRTAR